MSNILFSVVTGSESLAYQDVVSFMEIQCNLEPLEDILIDNLVIALPSSPDKTRLTTFGLYQSLKDGHVNVTQSLFVSEMFVNVDSVEYQTIRAGRMGLVSSQFFVNTIEEATKISNAIEIDPNLDDKSIDFLVGQKYKYKLLSLSLLNAAHDIGQNADIGMTTIGDHPNSESVDLMIKKRIGDVEKLVHKFNPNINRAWLFKIIRKQYFSLIKYT